MVVLKAIYSRAARRRLQVVLVWMLTRHPKFKPIYAADITAHDLMGQAEHLVGAGYHVAAGMLARAALESRVKRLALISPGWQSLTKPTIGRLARVLYERGVIDSGQQNRINRLYGQLSGHCHGNAEQGSLCCKAIRKTRGLLTELDRVAYRVLRNDATVIRPSVANAGPTIEVDSLDQLDEANQSDRPNAIEALKAADATEISDTPSTTTPATTEEVAS